MRNSVSENVCGAILGLHALTACDTTSAFKRRGKKTGLKLCNRIRNYVMVFNDLVVYLMFLMICLLYVKRLFASCIDQRRMPLNLDHSVIARLITFKVHTGRGFALLVLLHSHRAQNIVVHFNVQL